MSKKVKIFVIVIAVIAIIIGLVSYFGNSAPVTSNTGITSTGTVLPGGGGDVTVAGTTTPFSATLNTLSTISLDTSIFSDAGYKALRDFPISLGTAVIGRNNPFAPIGTDTTSTQSAGTLQLQTLAAGKILSTSAELGALVTTSSTDPVSVVFQYGTSDTFGTTTAPATVTKNGTALLTVTGLTPATTYYVEAVAVQGSITATGTVMTFTTAAAQKKH